jgi:hypothetical protein
VAREPIVRRKARRLVPPKPITVAVERPGAPTAYGVVLNISVEGVCVLTDTALAPGQTVHIELSFPEHHQTVHAPGRAVWMGPPEPNAVRCGLQFAWPRSPQSELDALIREIEC